MLGNVFSPSYARARTRDAAADPMLHCAMNVAVYGRDRAAWALTERSHHHVVREASSLAIGRSVMRWDGDDLLVDLDEARAPFGGRIRGSVRLSPSTWSEGGVALDPAGRHTWWPMVPAARVEVDLREPDVRFRGQGYHDANAGQEPLERAFSSWDWMRARMSGGRVALTYDVVLRDGRRASAGRLVERNGHAAPLPELGRSTLAKTSWRLERGVRSSAPATTRLVRTLEDTPFYARSIVEGDLLGERVVGMHETVSLDRFCSRWVQLLLPFRMGKAA